MELFQFDVNKTGTSIVTKDCGGMYSEDVTNQYKFAFGKNNFIFPQNYRLQ